MTTWPAGAHCAQRRGEPFCVGPQCCGHRSPPTWPGSTSPLSPSRPSEGRVWPRADEWQCWPPPRLRADAAQLFQLHVLARPPLQWLSSHSVFGPPGPWPLFWAWRRSRTSPRLALHPTRWSLAVRWGRARQALRFPPPPPAALGQAAGSRGGLQGGVRPAPKGSGRPPRRVEGAMLRAPQDRFASCSVQRKPTLCDGSLFLSLPAPPWAFGGQGGNSGQVGGELAAGLPRAPSRPLLPPRSPCLPMGWAPPQPCPLPSTRGARAGPR